MDRNFYFQKLAEERRDNISKELATRHLLKEATLNTSPRIREKLIAPRIVPVAIGISALLLVVLR